MTSSMIMVGGYLGRHESGVVVAAGRMMEVHDHGHGQTDNNSFGATPYLSLVERGDGPHETDRRMG